MAPLYEKFASDGVCNKILPLNQIKKRITVNKVTSFEIDAFTEDIFVPQDLATILCNKNLTMALPIHLYSPSESIHEHTFVKTMDALDSKVVVSNDGTFLPVSELKQYEDETIRNIFTIKDLEAWDSDRLMYRDKKITVSPELKKRLLEQGTVICSYFDIEVEKKVKVILRPERNLTIAKTTPLIRDGKIDMDGKETSINISTRQKQDLLNFKPVVVLVDQKPVTLKLSRPSYSNKSTNASLVNYSYAEKLSVHSTEQLCEYLNQLLQDPRAGDLQIYADDIPNWVKTLPNAHYFRYFDQLFNDPRSSTCLSKLNSEKIPPADLPSYEFALLTTFEQNWEMLGYSKGTLISSINLAPQEEMSIEVFTWDKHKVEEETTFGSEYEQNQEINTMARATTKIVRNLKETMDGSINANGDINVPTEYFTLNGQVGGELSQAIEEGLNSDVALLTEGAIKSSEKFKTNYQVKIVQTHEFGEENRTIRKLKNSNASRTLTFNYFEILENYKITTRIKDTSRFCILVDNPEFESFDLDFIMAYEYRLQQLLLSSNYKNGFEAARILAAQQWFDRQSAIKEQARSPEIVTTGIDPANPDSASSQTKLPLTGIYATAKQIYDVLDQFLNKLDSENALMQIANHHNPLHGGVSFESLADSRTKLKRYCFWIKLCNIYPSFQDKAQKYLGSLSHLFAGDFVQEPDIRGNEQEIIRELSFLIEDIDQFYAVKMVAASTVVQTIMKLPLLLTGPFSPFVIGLLEPVILDMAYNHDDMGLSSLIDKAQRNIKPVEDTQNAVIAHQQVNMPTAQAHQPTRTAQEIPQVYSHRELAEAHADFKKLIVHLEKHRTYYTNGIWQVEDENERLNRLKIKGLAKFVENRLLGFSGKKAIYPLKLRALPQSVRDALDKFRPNPANFKPEEIEEISLPTTGVHMETLLGQCDALEQYLVDRRDVDLNLRRSQANIVLEQALQAKEETRRLKNQVDKEIDNGTDTDINISSPPNSGDDSQ